MERYVVVSVLVCAGVLLWCSVCSGVSWSDVVV